MLNRRDMLGLSSLLGLATVAQASIPPFAKDEKSLKGTKTEQNLLTAFAGESQARNRYTAFAQKAEEEGYVEVARVFLETADQERVHAMRLFSCLDRGEDLEITAAFPAGKVSDTASNLRAAAAGEKHEWHSMYPEFAKIAEEEGFPKIARLFKLIATAEVGHEDRYLTLAKRVDEGYFKADDEIEWECMVCGYVYKGPRALARCPVCGLKQAEFRKRITYK
ncbi:MAG: rubrerythrin [Kiritimatiellia bacterium]